MRGLLLACFAAILLASCNKEQTMDVPKNRARMLIGENTTNAAEAMPTKWKSSEYRVYIPKGDGTDSINKDLLPECLKDDELQFFQNYFGKLLTGDNTCAVNDNGIYNTRWELTSNEDTVNLYDYERYFTVRTFKAQLKECTESLFTVRFEKEFTFNGVKDTLAVEQDFKR